MDKIEQDLKKLNYESLAIDLEVFLEWYGFESVQDMMERTDEDGFIYLLMNHMKDGRYEKRE